MKKIFSTLMLIALLAIVSASAMAQNSFNYQAVIREGGKVLVNKTVNLRLSVMLDDKVYYSEQQTATTNAYGNVSVSVGEGTPLTGSFEDIPWGSMRVMLQVEVSTDGTDKYTNMGSMQIQPVPYTLYAARATIIQPAVASDEPIFQVKDNAGNLMFAVYETGVKVYVDYDGSKAAKSKFAVAGRSAASKNNEDLLTINADGTRVYVDDNSKAAKSKFAVAGRSAKKGEGDLLSVDGSGSTIYVGGEGKAAKSKFAVVGQSASKAENNYSLDGDGSTIYVDFNDDASKAATQMLTIDGAQATFYIDIDNDNKNDDYNQNGKAAKSRFAVVGVGANKDEQTAFVVDGNGTIIYIDDIDSNAEGVSRFIVAGLTASNSTNTNNDKFFTINRDSTRIYVNDMPQTADTTSTDPGTTPVVTPSLASAFAIVGMTQKTDLLVVSKDSTIIKTDTYVAEEVQSTTGVVEKIIDDTKPKTIYTTGQIAASAMQSEADAPESFNITYAYYQSDNGEYLHLRYSDNYNNYQYRNYYLIDNMLYADSIIVSSAGNEFAIAPEHYTQPMKSDTSLLMVYERKMRNNGYSSYLENGQTTFYNSNDELVMTTEHNVLMEVDDTLNFTSNALRSILVQGLHFQDGAPCEVGDLLGLKFSNGQLYDNAADFDNCNEDVFGDEKEQSKLTVTQIEDWYAALKAGFTVKGLANNDVYGEVRFSENKERYAYGETLTLTADAKEGYVFTCWSDGCLDKERSVIVAGEASYQAIFEQPVLYVSGSKDANNENYGYTITKPLATLEAAAVIIAEAEPTDLKWTIRVDSALTGIQTLSAGLNDHALNITLEGNRGINRDGVPQDTLNGNNEGTTLAINTTVPVTIENLMITGGNATNGANGGGINIASGATVTLADGARVSGNKSIRNESNAETGCGGGVYNLGTLFMYGSAVIGDNTKQVAASSETERSNQAARGAGLFNQKGAKAYLGYSSENQKAELTGGIFYNFNAANNYMEGAGVFNRGTLKMNSGTIAYNGSNSSGVGVYNEDTSSGYFELSGGKISNNKSIGNPNWGGGGVRSATAFVMTGGEISDNYTNCTCDGSGVFLEYPFTMTGGVIKGNGPKTDVSFYEDATFSMGGSAVISGTVSYNKVVTICKPFDDTLTLAATINPGNYANNRTVLVLADSVKKSTTLAAEVGKFKLASADWRIIADGKMLKTDFVSVQGTYFDGSQRVDTSHVFIVGRKLAIQNLYACNHEVTQGEYVAVMGTNPSYNPSGDNYPVERVSWLDAINYCNSRSTTENLTPCYTIDNTTTPATVTCNFNANGYRLPTEAEWEYLAREGNKFSTYKFSGNDNIGVVAWYGENSGDNNGSNNPKTHEVKKKAANSLGLYDMCGNVWEWCYDWFGTIDANTPAIGPNTGNVRIMRGASFGNYYFEATVSYRDDKTQGSTMRYGFRVVRTAVITDSVTITFDTKDGDAMEPMKVWRGYRHNELPTPKKGTLNFGGWYTDSVCQTPFVVGGAITSDTTLYAKWLSDFIEVKGSYFDGSASVANSVVFIEGSKFTIQDLLVCDHEVTQKEWKTVMDLKDGDISDAYGQGENKPVYNVTWYQAIAYCNKLSLRDSLEPVYAVSEVTDWAALEFADIPKDSTKWNAVTCNFNANGYRLPTEVEWEYLARGGSNWDSYQYSGSDNIDEVAWHNYNSENVMHDVKTKNANALGIYDMSGNAWEWCWDLIGSVRILRGGSMKCNDAAHSPENDWCNVSKRATHYASVTSVQLGFRIVRTLTNTDTVTITFNTKGGVAMEPMKVWKGCRLNAPTPKNGTLNFGGWYIDSNCQIPFDYNNAITSDITLYANWLSDFVKVQGTYFDGAARVANSSLFIEGRQMTIRDLYACDHEVTQAEWQAIMGSNPSHFDGTDGTEADFGEIQANRPVDSISWYDMLVYCNKRSIAENLTPCYTIKGSTKPADWGTVPTSSDNDWNNAVCDFDANGYRLPTEVEWEYLARGGQLTGTQTTFSGSNTLDLVGWNTGNDNGKTHEVKLKKPNTLGLYDMSGNILEWCWDRRNNTIGDVTADTPAEGPSQGTRRARHGGGYRDGEDGCGVHVGSEFDPWKRDIDYGFRVVRTANFSIYIDGTNGNNGHSGLTPNNAFADLTAAVSLIETTAKPTLDYIIYISGTINGAQTLDAEHLNGKANSVTLCGLNGFDGDGVPQDMLDGKGSGTALTVATTVPVEIRNLQITGGNNSNGDGGGLYINNGANVTLENGTLIGDNTQNVATSTSYGNKAEYGGGVYVDGGTLTLKSGSVIGHNYVTNHGGGIYVYSGGKLYIESGAKIVYNYGLDEAGGVWIEQGAMAEMTGGEISHNAALTFAGGIEIMGTFTMNGGTISYNEVTEYIDGQGYAGGGAFIGPKGVFNMSGTASIICNKVRGCQGGAVKVAHETGTFRMTGGIIQGNTATECASGGGVRVESSNFFIGDSAYIASDNVVQLIEIDENNPGNPYKVNIIRPLTNDYAVTILPQNYTADVQVLQLADNATTNIEAECGKFAVVPVVSGTTSTSWSVNSTGYLQQGQSHTFVDLGLTSGNLWATCNVGATNPEDYGDYFAWGETETKENYSWETYTKLSDGAGISKYNNRDGKATLEPIDDAATANWGYSWSTPTEVDCQELINNCTWHWENNYNSTNVNGYLVTSKNNGNQIFLPAAGGYDGNGNGNIGTNGFYWTASVYGIYFDSANDLNFGKTYSPYVNYSYYRYMGFPVRPVKKKQ